MTQVAPTSLRHLRRALGLALAAGLILAAGAVPADRAAAQDGSETSGIFPYDPHVETLPNGLKVILVPMSSGGIISYWSIVRTGARDEFEPGRTGFAHFFEHMMFRGTEKFPASVYDEKVTSIGADANAFTSDDLTGYYLKISNEDLETAMELESDRFQRLSYAEELFRTEAGAVYGEYRKNRSNPFFTIYEAARREAFSKHTYGHTAMGYEEDIKQMPELYDYSKSFFSRYYRPENVVLLIVGDFEPQQVMEMVGRYYGEWEPGYVAPDVPVEPPQTAEKRIDVPYEGSSLPIVFLAYKGDEFDPADTLKTSTGLLCELAFGETSAIHKKLVLDEQVVEFISASPPFNRDPGLLNIISRVKDPEKVDYVIGEIDRVIAEFKASPPSQEDLDALKSRLKYGFLMGLDTPDRVARGLANMIAMTGGIEAVDTLYSTYDRVTPADIQQAAQTYLESRQRTIAILRGAS